MTAPFMRHSQRNHLFAADKKCVEAGEIVRCIVANGIVAAALEDCQHANNFNRPIKGSSRAGQRRTDSLQGNEIRDAREATIRERVGERPGSAVTESLAGVDPEASSKEPVLAVHRVSKSFEGVHALRDVSLQIFAGEIHALVGENGAGKSTLTKIMTGAVHPDSGRIEICGKEVGRNDPAHLPVAWASQQFTSSLRYFLT